MFICLVMCQRQLTKSNSSGSCCSWRIKTFWSPRAGLLLRACLIVSTFSGPSPHKRMPQRHSVQIMLAGGMTTTQMETRRCPEPRSVVRLMTRRWVSGVAERPFCSSSSSRWGSVVVLSMFAIIFCIPLCSFWLPLKLFCGHVLVLLSLYSCCASFYGHFDVLCTCRGSLGNGYSLPVNFASQQLLMAFGPVTPEPSGPWVSMPSRRV